MRDQTPPHAKAHTTGRWAEIIFRALSSRVAKRWKFVSFRGKGKGEWRGIIDVLAVRKDTTQPANAKLKHGDLLEIVLIQVKGGGARGPTHEDCIRLREVAKYYHARSVVQFQWRKGVWSRFLELDLHTLEWKPTTGTEVFA